MLRYFQNFLMGVSGTNIKLLRDLEGDNYTAHSRRVRAGLGAIILLTFMVTWVSSAWMATTFGVSVYVGAGIGLLAGLIKLVWDRRVAVAATTKMAWARMVVALPISLLMAIPLALSLFGDYSTGVSKEDDKKAIVQKYQEDMAERTALEEEVDSLQRGQRFFQTMASAEVGGLWSKPGTMDVPSLSKSIGTTYAQNPSAVPTEVQRKDRRACPKRANSERTGRGVRADPDDDPQLAEAS